MPTPLYHQIYLILREQIRAGAFESKARMPTEAEISAEYSVSRITAKRALDELAVDGLVVRRRGRGTSVVGSVVSEPVEANINGLIENLLMVGLETKVDILQFDYIAAPSAVRGALKLGVARKCSAPCGYAGTGACRCPIRQALCLPQLAAAILRATLRASRCLPCSRKLVA